MESAEKEKNHCWSKNVFLFVETEHMKKILVEKNSQSTRENKISQKENC